ncbi:hypothetical protein TruAng_012151 [Truncatella angustata]|nr:hypothetical protein TruAng_012151 [Truncatella angustata]
MESKYRKHFVPIESDPDIFNKLIYSLGVTSSFCFEDVMSLDEPAALPHPALALILIFPTAQDYEIQRAREEELYGTKTASHGSLVWFKQTINNACGLYAVLHSLINNISRSQIQPGSFFDELMSDYRTTSSSKSHLVLEESAKLAEIYNNLANEGCSPVPPPEEEIDFHYVCFVKADSDKHIYELDGDRTGTIDTGVVLEAEDDVLSEKSVQFVRGYIDRVQHKQDGMFALMALVQHAKANSN